MPDWITDPKAIISIIVTTLGIGYIGWWVGRVKRDQWSFEKFVKVVRADVKEILSRPEPAVTETDRSAQLSELGIKIADRLEARDWARQVAPGLLSDIREREPFEIEEGPAETANMKLLDQQWKRTVSGTGSKLRVDTSSVLLVMRIVLKDELMRLASEGAFEDARQSTEMVPLQDSDWRGGGVLQASSGVQRACRVDRDSRALAQTKRETARIVARADAGRHWPRERQATRRRPHVAVVIVDGQWLAVVFGGFDGRDRNWHYALGQRPPSNRPGPRSHLSRKSVAAPGSPCSRG